MISQSDKDRITKAIRQVEARTSGEIFCVLAWHSSDHHLVPVAWAAAIALALPLSLLHFSLWPAWIIYLIQLAVFVAAALILSLPAVRFRIVPKRAKRERAHALALQQFFAHGLQHTQDRTGVLIFASMAEHYAEILADAGINAKVNQTVWDQAVAAMIDGLKNDRVADGFVAAVERCGTVLAEHFPPGTLNRDELPNKLVEI